MAPHPSICVVALVWCRASLPGLGEHVPLLCEVADGLVCLSTVVAAILYRLINVYCRVSCYANFVLCNVDPAEKATFLSPPVSSMVSL